MNALNELKIFCENFKYLRRKESLSKKQMAEICNIGVKSVEKIENGVIPKRMNVNVVFNISDYFGVSPYKLFESKIFVK